MLRDGGRRRTVAVKVRHPGVASRIKQDFQLLIPLARSTSRFKSLKARSPTGVSCHDYDSIILRNSHYTYLEASLYCAVTLLTCVVRAPQNRTCMS